MPAATSPSRKLTRPVRARGTVPDASSRQLEDFIIRARNAGLIEHRHAERLRLLELAPGVLARDQPRSLSADGPGDFAPELLRCARPPASRLIDSSVPVSTNVCPGERLTGGPLGRGASSSMRTPASASRSSRAALRGSSRKRAHRPRHDGPDVRHGLERLRPRPARSAGIERNASRKRPGAALAHMADADAVQQPPEFGLPALRRSPRRDWPPTSCPCARARRAGPL